MLLLTVLCGSPGAFAQTTAFTYQGRLTDASQPASGTYAMQFRLYDTDGTQPGGNLLGAQTALVTASGGIFTVRLDFGAAAFSTSAARYLEIQIGSVTLTPRQEIAAAPFAVRALGAGTADALSNLCQGCVTNAQIATLDGAKITGAVGTAANFSGNLSGDVAGTQGATVIQPNAVTAAKIASNQVVKSVNGLRDNITLAGGSGIAVTPAGSTVNIALTSAIPRKYTIDVNYTIAGQTDILHFLGTNAVLVQVYRLSNNLQITLGPLGGSSEGFAQVVDNNTVRVGVFTPGVYRIVVIG